MQEELKESRAKRIVLAVVAVLLIGAVFFAAMQTMIGRAYRTRWQNLMRQNEYELMEKIRAVEVTLGKLAAAQEAQQSALLEAVQDKARAAAHTLAQMEMQTERSVQAMTFVNKLADYAGALQRGTEGGTALDESDRGHLHAIAQHCHMLREALQERESDEPIEWQEDPFLALQYDGMYAQREKEAPKALGTQSVSAEQALVLAKRYVGEQRVIGAAEENGLEGEIPCWGVAVTTKEDGVLHLQITKRGGKVLQMTAEQPAAGQAYAVDVCRQRAQAFLTRNGYENTEAVAYREGIGAATFTFVPVQDGVKLYPDLICVQVSFATGNVIGVEASGYLNNHVRREFGRERLEEEEIRVMVHALELCSIGLAVIPVFARETLCYEVRGTHEGTEYLIYLEASTGREMEVLQVVRTQEAEYVI